MITMVKFYQDLDSIVNASWQAYNAPLHWHRILTFNCTYWIANIFCWHLVKYLISRTVHPNFRLRNLRNAQFGIIPTECVASKCVHLFLGRGKLSERIELANILRPQSQEWTENYRHLTSLLAASWQIPSKYKSTKPSRCTII